MNTKETQQVMNSNDQYISLYDYRGQSSRETGIGQKVYAAAKEKGIHVIYADLPAERQREDYNRVATYPKSFLDKYFNAPAEPESAISVTIDLQHIYERLVSIENQFSSLLKKLETNTIIEDDDDLPF
jgi:hypothetical protein